MCLISVKIHKAEKSYHCTSCDGAIIPKELYVRIFGMASSLDPPGELMVHLMCIEGSYIPPRSDQRQILKAMDEYGISYDLEGNCIKNIHIQI